MSFVAQTDLTLRLYIYIYILCGLGISCLALFLLPHRLLCSSPYGFPGKIHPEAQATAENVLYCIITAAASELQARPGQQEKKDPNESAYRRFFFNNNSRSLNIIIL